MKQIFIIIVLLIHTYIAADSLLEQAIAYAHTHEEYVEPANKNLFYPDFSAFYKKNRSSWLGRLLGMDDFPLKPFINKVKKLTQEREKKGLTGNFIRAFCQEKETYLIVWGNLFGAYHSFVRGLQYLKEQGFIDNNLKIIKPRCYFVFNGNVVNRSPYILETLSLIIDIMEANPEAAFYIRGNHEDKEEWHNYTLARALQIKAQNLSKMVIPFSDVLDRFFKTLPLALYLVDKCEPNIINLGRISHYDRNYTLLNEHNYADFFEETTSTKISTLKLPHTPDESAAQKHKKVMLRVIVKGEDHQLSYRYNEGLLEGSTQGEATSWSLFSAPTLIYQQLCDFFFDAFSIIRISDCMHDATITLYHQDVRKKEGFTVAESYNLISTQPIHKESVVQPEILFAATMDLSKSTYTIGRRVDDGLRLRFEVQQDEGGIKGFQPRVFTFDDQYTPNITRQRVDYIKNVLGIDKMVGSQGSPSLESYLDMVERGEVLVMFPFTGAPIFRKPELKYVIHGARLSYEYEGIILSRYAYEVLKTKRIAIFYQNDSFGKGPLKGAIEYFKGKDATLLEVPHERNDVSFGPHAKKIREFNPEAILFFATSPATRGLITLMGIDFFAPRKLLGISVFEDAFEQFIKDVGLTFIFTRMVPNPHTSELQIAQEYRQNTKKYDIKIDKLAFEMYINASILFSLIDRIDGQITKDALIAAAEATKNYNLKGLLLNFNTQTREFSQKIWLDTGENEWREIDIATLKVTHPKEGSEGIKQ